MAAISMLYILPALLGTTFDARTNKVGIQIFDPKQLEEAQTISHHTSDVKYKLIEDSMQARDFLDVGGQLSLKLKSGQVDIQGYGSYLKDRGSKDDSVDFLIKIQFQTITKTLPTTLKPSTNPNLDPKDFGSHYVRSITYGGELLATVTFRSNNVEDKQKIKGGLQGGISSKGTFGIDVKGFLDMVNTDLTDSVSMNVDYFANVPLKGVPRSMEGLMSLVNDFPKHIKEFNEGIGVPISMELYPLNVFNESIPKYEENQSLMIFLDRLEMQYDDLKTAKGSLNQWLDIVLSALPEEIKKNISNFQNKLDSNLRVFEQCIRNLDLSIYGSTQQFLPAFQAYEDNGSGILGKYSRQFLKLKQQTVESIPDLHPGSTTYIHWGHDKCSSSHSELTYSGVVGTTQSLTGDNEYLCIPLEPQWNQLGDQTFNAALGPNVTSVQYGGHIEEFHSKLKSQIACSLCLVKTRTAFVMKPAGSTCPAGWTEEYSGYLMAASDSKKTEYICVNKDLQTISTKVISESLFSDPPIVVEVTAECGSLPCEVYKPNVPIPCIVCTK